MIKKTSKEFLYYKYDNIIYKVPTFGKIFKIIENARGIKETLAIYRDRKGSISNNKFLLLKYNWIIYNKELGFNKLKSLLLILNFLEMLYFVSLGFTK